MDFENMTIGELLGTSGNYLNEIKAELPVEGRAEFNAAQVKLEKALREQDMSAVLALAEKHGVKLK